MDRQGMRPGLDVTGSMLKNVAIITMFIDHIGAALMESWLVYGNTMGIDRHFYWQIDRVLRSIGRLAFPLFIFLLVEGFFYTRSRAKYLIRLTAFCLISEIPFDLAFRQHYMKPASGQLFELGYQNVFFTLAIGFAAIWLIEILRPRNICLERKRAENILISFLRIALCMAAAAAACGLATWMKTDYSWSGVLAIILAYLIRMTGAKDLEVFAIVAALTLAAQIECIAILDFFLIKHYQGRKGRSGNRWFFYIFYPAHLLILGLIRMYMGV